MSGPARTATRPRRRAGLAALAASLGLLLAAAAPAADPAPSGGITGEQAAQILEELRAIRALLEKQGAAPSAGPLPAGEPATARIPWVERPSLGPPDAAVVVVEFTDYACPYCQRFHQATWPALKRDLVDGGQVRWVVRDLPLPIHPDARGAAEAAHCAGEQGQFWAMRTVLYANRGALGRADLERHAGTLPLDLARFRRCLDGGAHRAAIEADTAAAAGARITGTPTFLVGRLRDGFVEGQLIVGAQAAAVFDGAIRLELAAAAKSRAN